MAVDLPEWDTLRRTRRSVFWNMAADLPEWDTSQCRAGTAPPSLRLTADCTIRIQQDEEGKREEWSGDDNALAAFSLVKVLCVPLSLSLSLFSFRNLIAFILSRTSLYRFFFLVFFFCFFFGGDLFDSFPFSFFSSRWWFCFRRCLIVVPALSYCILCPLSLFCVWILSSSSSSSWLLLFFLFKFSRVRVEVLDCVKACGGPGKRKEAVAAAVAMVIMIIIAAELRM
jgi:hypothetical protein